MPPMTRRGRYQAAVLWAYAGVDRYGQIVRSEPREIRVRWEEAETTEDTPDGKSLDLRFQVVVGEEIPLESLMWKGTLAAWYGTTGTGGEENEGEQEVCRVVSYTEVPDVQYRRKLRSVSLARYQGAPPRAESAGEAVPGDLTITASGFANAICDDCTDLNGSFLATQSRNEIDVQEWRTTFLELDTGTGTGTLDAEWQIVVTRQRRENGDTITARFYRTLTGVVGTYGKSQAAWDGESPLTLTRLVVDGSCSWPATITIQGAEWVAPAGNVVVEGAGYSAGTCEGCLSLNADFTLLPVVAGTSWRTATPFSFDGASHVWTAWKTATASQVELREATDNTLKAAWRYDGAWDGLARVSFAFAGAQSATCCVWPATLAVRGD